MTLRNFKWTALVAVAMITQIGCYNTYRIDKTELAKLESSVERVEVVEVLADCPQNGVAYRSLQLDGTRWAEADLGSATANDATTQVPVDELGGCTLVPVSTVNALTVLTVDGGRQRVTPFNFVMDDIQLVSPEYNLLVQIDQVEGAEVREFSTWKTVATIAGVTLGTVGTFVGISLLAPAETGFN